MNEPKEIWLQTDDNPASADAFKVVSWCESALNSTAIPYILKSDYDALQAKLTEAKRLNAELTILAEFKGKPPSEIKRQWARMLAETTNDTSIKELIRWLNDDDRKEAILSFTEGSARHVAYAAEAAMKRDRETCPYMPLTIEQARITNLTNDLDSRNAKVAQLQAKLTEAERLNKVALGALIRLVNYADGDVGAEANAIAAIKELEGALK